MTIRVGVILGLVAWQVAGGFNRSSIAQLAVLAAKIIMQIFFHITLLLLKLILLLAPEDPGHKPEQEEDKVNYLHLAFLAAP